MPSITRILVLAVLMAAGASPGVAQEALAGVWEMDTTRSLSLERAFQLHAEDDGLRSRGSLPGGQPVPGGYTPGTGGAGVDLTPTTPVSPQEAAAQARPLTYNADVFEVVLTDSSVVFHPLNLAYDNVELLTDGKKRDVFFGLMDDEGRLKAEWKGERLKVERKIDDMEVTEVWDVDEDGALVAEVTVKGRMLAKTLRYRRVYRRRT